MNITELKLIGNRVCELYEEGVLSIYKDHTNEHLSRVHLTEEAFKEFSEGREVKRESHSDSYDEEFFEEDDVTFFHLVEIDE